MLAVRRRSQVVRQRSAKPLFIGSIPIAASKSSFVNGCGPCSQIHVLAWVTVENFFSSINIPLEPVTELFLGGTRHYNEIDETNGNFPIAGDLLFRLNSRR